jgi:hypothetical protein
MTDHCAGCGFVYDLNLSATAARDIRERVDEAVAILRTGDVDVLLVQRERVLAARRMDRPDCPTLGRDERVAHDGYAEQNPDDVARQRGRLPLPRNVGTVVAVGRDPYDARGAAPPSRHSPPTLITEKSAIVGHPAANASSQLRRRREIARVAMGNERL